MKSYISTIIITLFALLGAMSGHALDLDTYASASRLAEGRWVKISVNESGVYAISDKQLQSWGFSNPSAVNVYGYGGRRIGDALTNANYIDDLPLVQSLRTGQGLVFYGVGPENWQATSSGAYVNNSNIYTQVGYYFLSDIDIEARSIDKASGKMQGAPLTQYVDRLHYELDRLSLGEAGYLLVGENLKSGAANISFDTPDAISAVVDCGVVCNNSGSGTIEISANDTRLTANASDKITPLTSSSYTHGSLTTTSHAIDNPGEKVDISIFVQGAQAMKECRLDYVSLAVTRQLKMKAAGHMNFWLDQPNAKLASAQLADIVVWDVTDPLDIKEMDIESADNSLTWSNPHGGVRSYAAFSASASLPAPAFVGRVANQNLHALQGAEMVIFSTPELMAQARRIANMHASAASPINAIVLNANEVYNEFASGMPDVSALRKCLKMLYDRGNAIDSVATLQYVLLMGRATYDNRHLTSQFDGVQSPNTLPCWLGGERRSQLSDNTGYGTDDFIAMLADYSGTNLGLDDLSVAVGRIPSTNADQAKSSVDKLLQYVHKNKAGTWKNSFVFLADDGDNGVHARQTESMIAELQATPQAQSFVSKVYVDAYDIISGSCEGGRQDMYRLLNEGAVWWNYCGHANNHSWTAENMLNYSDINNLFLTRLPVLMAATCDFLRWDSNTTSGGEILFNHRYGGNIATISATRPVYITDNGYFTRAVGRAIYKRNADGSLPRLGDIYRNAKNNILNDVGERRSNPNRLRYVLMGDPALQLATPSNIAVLDSIGDQPLDPDAQLTLKAMQRTTLKGSMRSPSGEVLADFNGTVQLNIYDAEHSVTTQGKRDDNIQLTFEQHGDLLFSGSAPVTNGRFSINIAMPGEVADNFRPASVNMYGAADNGAEAVGVNSDFYVYGIDESAPIDDIAPVIENMWLNSDAFKPGQAVNDSPMLIACIRDDVGINLSSAGIGHQMSITIDGNKSYNDVALYYTPASDGTPSGTINYPLPTLVEGEHTLRLRIWDTALNSATQEITFNVRDGIAPHIFDIYCDANPASTEVNFYIKHDRPESQLSATIAVYTLMGRKVWESTVDGRSDMDISAPVNWDLRDNGGRRVPRGIYLYRASITADGITYDTASKKIAVTATH